jgi:hypothetical protein
VSIVIVVTAIVIWLIAGVCCFRACRVDLGASGNSAIADFICSLLLWWLVLPPFAVVTGVKLGRYYGDRLIERIKHKRLPQQLRAGAENGLYE